MSDIPEEFRKLRETTEANRREFLQIELQTCFIAIERARLELSLHNPPEAEKEFRIVRHGEQVIEKFLNDPPGTCPEIEQKFAELKEAVLALRRELDKYPG